MQTWKKLPTVSAPMSFQMGLDDFLFHQMIDEKAKPGFAGQPLLRFYYASEAAVSLGYAYAGWKSLQAGEDASELFESNTEKQLPVCRRLTGGGRVVHGNDLMFSLFALKTDDESFKSVRESYHKIHEVLQKALKDFGLETTFYCCDDDLPRGKDCFVFPIATDLAFKNKKIAGGGQKRSVGVMLHQESIQLKTLKVDAEDLIKKLETHFEKTFAIKLEDLNLKPAWLQEAEKRGAEKYQVISKEALNV